MADYEVKLDVNLVMESVTFFRQVVVRPIILNGIVAYLVSCMAKSKGHNPVVWFFASLANPLLAVCFSASGNRKIKHREKELREALRAGKVEKLVVPLEDP